jgi:protein ImuB
MRLSEALARCPDLQLIAADPGRAASAWESALGALEGIGAAVEPARAGEAYFDAAGLCRLYGGRIEGVLACTRKAVGLPARIGAAPSRFCSFAAATSARPGRAAKIAPGHHGPRQIKVSRTSMPGRGATIVSTGAERAFLAPLPVGLLRARPEVVTLAGGRRAADLPSVLERLGIRTLGQLAALERNAVADSFGQAGLWAHELAMGIDAPLHPRSLEERLGERIELPEAVSGPQLERMLQLLIDRLLARRERAGRGFRKLLLGARFVEDGTWRREVALRQASASRDRLRLALAPKLAALPAPIDQLSLEVVSFGPPLGDQLTFRHADGQERRKRLREALRQTRAAAGTDALLRVLEVDPRSRIPERRALLTPFSEE